MKKEKIRWGYWNFTDENAKIKYVVLAKNESDAEQIHNWLIKTNGGKKS